MRNPHRCGCRPETPKCGKMSEGESAKVPFSSHVNLFLRRVRSKPCATGVLPGAVWDIGQEGRGTGHKGLYHGIIQSLVSQLYRCRCCRRWRLDQRRCRCRSLCRHRRRRCRCHHRCHHRCTLPLLSDAHQHAPYSVTSTSCWTHPRAASRAAPPRAPVPFWGLR